ncbi:glycosyl hydrolase family 35 [Kribbella voronezhensis]|uniref:Glycosyl hydrolase family 35 n=1 Tax=Kribbella voronezhensis TaxID=2512212 RepID=A0A4R7T5W0_9ACTN|nr:beta-galactosidase [Kribbella voronezhensis]TDU87184.1 glycosyl hydrolase family 35 [Kribbella voronezhensis]
MSSSTTVGTGVELDAQGIWIDGRPKLLLCASLFYFRLPREQWRSRLEQIRTSGYTCVDVYLPWNFHEVAPGRWSFDGRRDVAAFLDLAHEVGLSVIARPGPYICSEWDGGALPAWLGLDPDVRVRQNEPRYLAQVTAWFDQVLPLLAERQYPAGPVVMVQLENELDFFDCGDRTGYLTSLRDQAIDHGITVPLIACAGQGDLAGATGDVPGVVAACNFYPNDDSPHIEAEVRRYAGLLADRGLPLLITETNRRHRTLRRLLASGAALIAPYLQSSGWNFGFTPSTGNWGAPGNFMSHDYDFGGYVSPTGATRPEYDEARVLARVVAALGSQLALATATVPRVEVTADFPTSSSISALDLDGGGQLIAVPNLDQAPGRAVVNGVSVAVAAGSCPLMLVDLPLQDTTLTLASADLVAVGDGVLVFSSVVPVTVVLGQTQVEIPATPGRVERRVVDGIDLVVLTPPNAARFNSIRPDRTIELDHVRDRKVLAPATEVRTVRQRSGAAPAKSAGTHDLPPSLESLGVFRGRGTYSATTDLTGIDELLLVGACDIVELSIAGQLQPAVADFGATRRVDVRAARGRCEIDASVEIWGHANFDDARLPALRLGALRGLGTVWKVEGVQDLDALWTVDGHWSGEPAPIRSLGGWSSTRVGVPITYSRRLDLPTRSALHFSGLDQPITVTLDDGEPITVHRENPWLMLPAGTTEVAVTLQHDPSGAGLHAELLSLQPVMDWTCTVQDDELLTAFATGSTVTSDVELPLTLEPGEEVWLDIDLPADHEGLLIRFGGSQLRVTGWAAGECLGRTWIGDRPAFSGGDPDVLWVPAGWSGLTLLLRGVAGPADPVLRTLRLSPATTGGENGAAADVS